MEILLAMAVLAGLSVIIATAFYLWELIFE